MVKRIIGTKGKGEAGGGGDAGNMRVGPLTFIITVKEDCHQTFKGPIKMELQRH